MKNKEFNRLHSALIELVKRVDEDCPYDYRTDALAEALFEALNVLQDIEIAKIKENGNDGPDPGF
jgi:hypothetical protein